MTELERTIMKRDGLTLSEARDLIAEVSYLIEEALAEGYGDPEEIFMDELGLEPDYILDLPLFTGA